MASVSITDLNNAKLDVDHIADLATSSDPEATDRFGNTKKTWAGIEEDLGAAYAVTATGANRNATEMARDQALSLVNSRDSIAIALADTTIPVGGRFSAPLTDGSWQAYTKTSTSVATPVGGPVASATRIKPVTELLYGAAEFTNNGFILATGAFVSSASWGATGFLEVLGGETYIVYSQCIGSARHCWYDKDKVLISAFGGSEPTFQALTATAPSNARFLRVSAQQWPVTSAYVQGSLAAYNIRKQKQVSLQHPVQLPASLVDNNGTPASVTLAALTAAQLASDQRMAALTSELDLATDPNAPFFVNMWQFTKSPVTPATQLLAAITARNSDTQFTVASGLGANFVAGGALVVEDGTTGEITSFLCDGIAGDVVNITGTLPANPISAQCMHDSQLGQHLSRLAYKGLADFVLSRTQRNSYKKNVIFEYHPPVCGTPAPADANVYTLDGLTKRFDVLKLGGAGYGGFVSGTTTLAKLCGTKTGAQYNIGAAPGSQYLGKGYDVTSAAAGDGISITIPAARVDGVLEIPVSAQVGTYTSSVDGTTQTYNGKVRLQVLGDGVSIYDQTFDAGRVQYAFVPFSGYGYLEVRVMLAETKVSWVRLCALYAYPKSAKTPTTGFFQSGDVIAFTGDSWEEFPVPTGGETPPLRPDGSTAGGMQFLSERIRTRLASQGVSVTTLNMSKGGQTSAWGLYWIDKILSLTPRPTHCVVCFSINDNNSMPADASNIDSPYDFDPANQWVNKVKSAGGVKGSVSAARWFTNMQSICSRLTKAGIKPVVLMPPVTASTSQAQSIRSNFLHKIACGFRDTNTAGGG